MGHMQEATCHDHLGRHTAAKRLDLLPDVAEESVAGPATEQHDGVTPLRYIAMAANERREWSPMRFGSRPRPLK